MVIQMEIAGGSVPWWDGKDQRLSHIRLTASTLGIIPSPLLDELMETVNCPLSILNASLVCRLFCCLRSGGRVYKLYSLSVRIEA